jgi:hypothetical protein
MSGMVYNKVKNSNMKQTAVEWLVEQLKESIGLKDMQVIEKAKEMERKQAEKLKDFDTWKEWKNKTN